MLGHAHFPLGASLPALHLLAAPVLALADPNPAALIHPIVLLALCVVAGVATVLLLPSGRETPFARIGGVVLIAVGLILAALLVRVSAHAGGEHLGVYFWVFSAIGLAGAIRVVTHPRPVYSALYFVLTVFATAGLFILLYAEFMAAALVLIYAGAILVTYVFVIMLAAQARPDAKIASQLGEYDAVSREPLVAAAVGFALMGVLLFVIFDRPTTVTVTSPDPAQDTAIVSAGGSTQRLGVYLFQNQAINLELAGLILTVAMVGAIVIARRRVVNPDEAFEPTTESFVAPATPIDDNPHSIPVYGTENRRQKAYPET